jgi:PAS domain S-box-containing protein
MEQHWCATLYLVFYKDMLAKSWYNAFILLFIRGLPGRKVEQKVAESIPIKAFKMIVIYFINGLGLFTLGLSIVFHAGKRSAFKLADTVWLIGAFGVIHGLSEWTDMFLLIERSPAAIGILKTIRLVTLPVSFYCLMRFGILVIVRIQKRFFGLKKLPIILSAAWACITALSNVPLLSGPIWARYLLGLPAGLLTSYALLLQIREPIPVHEPAAKQLLKISAGAFFFYAIFAGLVVPDAGFFPASVINYSSFTKVFGIPVQVFRTACALAVLYSMIRVLRLFDRETKTALRESGDVLQEACDISARYVLHDEKGNAVSIARDMTERKHVDAVLQKWSDIFNHTKIGVVIVGPEAKRLDMMNQAFAVLHGYTVEGLTGRPIVDIMVPEGRAELQRQLSTITQKGSYVFDAINIRKDGTTFPVQVDVAAVKDGNGNILYYVINMLDISERKQVEEILRFAARRWRTTFDAMKEMVFLLDREGKIKRCNSATAAYFDKPFEEINGRDCCEFIHGTMVPAEQCPFQRMIQTKRREHIVLQRGEKWFDVVVDPLLDDAGAVNGAVHIMYDVTERKRAEEQIRESLGEKEILLKEIHHRVKNNLQVIMSLLRHQAEYAQDQKIHDIFLESQSRIKAMSFIHEKLYQSDNLAKVDLRDYISSLAKNLFSTYKVNAAQIQMAVDADDISLGVDTAIPCGLIINELVSNSLKHAFPDNRTGRIAITVRTVRPGELELVVGDDGVGIPMDLDIINAKSLGLHLVTLLAKNQLRGHIEMMRNRGTSFRIRFKGVEA